MRKIYVILKKLKLCIKGIHFSRLKREITHVKRMISELKSKMCEWYITEWIRDCMMDVHSSSIIRHIINDVCSQNHINVWRYQKGNMKSKKYRDPAHVCAQVRKWIYSVFCRILSWEVDLLPLIELLVIFMICGVLTLLSEIYQLCHGDQFYWWKKPEYPERTTDNGQATGKLYHLRMRVECTLFALCKAGWIVDHHCSHF